MQDEVGGSIAPSDTGADEADGADWEEVGARSPLGTLGPDEGDAEHAVVLQGVVEHVAEAWLENVKREEGVGEKEHPGKRHDGDGGG